MVLCNVTKQLKGSGLFIDFSQCNFTSGVTPKTTNHTSPPADSYDPEGAMKYIIAVVLVYGIAVMGVVALGFLKKRHIRNIDKEAIEFVKHFDDVRRSIDQQTRVGAVSSLLQSLHHSNATVEGNAGAAEQKNLFGKFELFALPMSPIKEERNKDENNNNSVKEKDIATNVKGEVAAKLDHAVAETVAETNLDVGMLNGYKFENLVDVHSTHV